LFTEQLVKELADFVALENAMAMLPLANLYMAYRYMAFQL